ncbi:hypothetical protein [Metabacillus fastidiosus]|uniref:hypothetical protein n=1 Tax=Metabacillus fastidiosus TaxID=1458 RepID=UPI002E1ED37B|nr:hypothetical protein [Metabacillus fastidiosus]
MWETQLSNVEIELLLKLHYENGLTICEIERVVLFARRIIEDTMELIRNTKPLSSKKGVYLIHKSGSVIYISTFHTNLNKSNPLFNHKELKDRGETLSSSLPVL